MQSKRCKNNAVAYIENSMYACLAHAISVELSHKMIDWDDLNNGEIARCEFTDDPNQGTEQWTRQLKERSKE